MPYRLPSKEHIIYFILFLFPSLAVTVRHWVSGLFGLLCLVSIIFLVQERKQIKRINKEYIVLAVLFSLFFISFIISSVYNGWDAEADSALGTELRFLFIIPFLLLIGMHPEKYRYAGLCLFYGCLTGLFFAFASAIYDIWIINGAKATGIYGHTFMGSVSALFIAIVVVGLFSLNLGKKVRIVAAISALCGMVVIAYSTAKIGYVVIITTALYVVIMLLKGKKAVYFSLATIIALGLIVNLSQEFKQKLESVYDHITQQPGVDDRRKTLITRIDMIKASVYIAKNSPIFGIGRFKFNQEAQKLVATGKIDETVAWHSHPHNIFAEVLVSKGLLGLVILTGLYGYLFVMFVQARSYVMGTIGINYIITMTLLSMTISAPVMKGNYVALFLIISCVLFVGRKTATMKLN